MIHNHAVMIINFYYVSVLICLCRQIVYVCSIYGAFEIPKYKYILFVDIYVTGALRRRFGQFNRRAPSRKEVVMSAGIIDGPIAERSCLL